MGTDHWGLWLLGVIALTWTIDCFIGFYLTLPKRQRNIQTRSTIIAASGNYWQRWKPAWKIRWSSGPTKLNFDLHRAFGLWTWALLFVIAFTGFSLNLYREVFFTAEEGHGAGGVGHKAVFLDAKSGELLGDFIPWRGTAADLFVQAQFPLHSGRILGLPGRILISIMGLVIAMLSITGVIIWHKRYKARVRSAQKTQQEATELPVGIQ